jgi:hypothetical protein
MDKSKAPKSKSNREDILFERIFVTSFIKPKWNYIFSCLSVNNISSKFFRSFFYCFFELIYFPSVSLEDQSTLCFIMKNCKTRKKIDFEKYGKKRETKQDESKCSVTNLEMNSNMFILFCLSFLLFLC